MCDDLDHLGATRGAAGSLTRRRLLSALGIGVAAAACGGGSVSAPTASPAPAAASPAATTAPTVAATPAPTAAPSPTPPPAPTAAAAGITAGFIWYKQSAFLWKGERTIYIDPWGLSGDLAPADAIFVTHIHGDHFSPDDIKRITGPKTVVVAPKDVAAKLTGEVKAVAPGDRLEVAGIKVQAVPAYNIVQARLSAHPKANNWVGYLIDLPGRTVYHAGDTDNVPELRALKTDAAFVPIDGSFAMSPAEAGALVKAMRPKVAVPMHFGFVRNVGKGSDGEVFRREASPIEVVVMKPLTPFLTP